jgi:exodeoxyribonuclease VII large subunit
VEATPAERVAETPSGIWVRAGRALADLGGGIVEGEVQKAFRSQAGHLYIDLADGDAVIGCVMWRDTARNVTEELRQGQLIQAEYRRIRVYAPRGQVQLDLASITPTGEGELLRRVHDTLARLVAEGLTDPARKPPLPRIPRRIGLVTGRGSDAEADVLTALRDRFPAIPVVVAPALVQGAQAVGSIVDALGRLASEPEVDVIVLARGGGSVEDLMPFSDEALCRAIAALGTPVVTSIGHTKQRPNCDHVATAAAEVPARAAEYIVPSATELRDRIDRIGADIAGYVRADLDGARSRIDRSAMRPAGRAALVALRGRVDLEAQRLDVACSRGVEVEQRGLDATARTLAASFAAVPRTSDLDRLRERLARGAGDLGARLQLGTTTLTGTLALIRARDWRERGFALVRDQSGALVRDAGEIAVGARLAIHLHGGVIEATADVITPDDEEQRR